MNYLVILYTVVLKESDLSSSVNDSRRNMAFMYPMHFPAVPLRWDESAWAIPCADAVDEVLLSRLESRISAQVI